MYNIWVQICREQKDSAHFASAGKKLDRLLSYGIVGI